MLISIIIPVYNIDKYIKKCVESIINQSYKNLEIILVDDGSKDKSPLICDELAKMDDRIKVIHKKNGGLSSARNAGIEIAKGEYLGFVDGDDWIHKNMYEYMINIALKEKADIVQCEFEKVFDDNKKEDNLNEEKIKIFNSLEGIKNLYSPEINISSIVTWSKIYNKDLFKDIRFPNGKIHEDEFTTYKLFYKANKIAYTNRKLYYYRQTTNSIMNAKYNKNRLNILEALEERLEFIYKNISNKEIYDLCAENYMKNIMNSYFLYKKSHPEDKDTLKGIQMKAKEHLYLLSDCKLINLKRKIKIRLFAINPKIISILKKKK